MSQSQTSKLGRRQVIAGAGTAGALAAAVALKPATQGAATPEATAKPKPDEGGGYRVTAHVLRYYQTTKV